MKIEVKSISVNLANSEETHCFSAVVHVDGKKAFAVRNHGHGGADIIDTLPGYTGPSQQEVNQWLKDKKPADTSHGVTIEHDLEIEIGEQVNAFLSARERKKIENKFAKMLATECIGLKDGKFYTWKLAPTAENLKRLRAAKPDYEFINDGDEAVRARAIQTYCPNIYELG